MPALGDALQSQSAQQLIDRLGEPQVALADAAHVMTGETKVDPVPNACEFRVMIDLLRMEGDPAQKTEGLAEILEL